MTCKTMRSVPATASIVLAAMFGTNAHGQNVGPCRPSETTSMRTEETRAQHDSVKFYVEARFPKSSTSQLVSRLSRELHLELGNAMSFHVTTPDAESALPDVLVSLTSSAAFQDLWRLILAVNRAGIDRVQITYRNGGNNLRIPVFTTARQLENLYSTGGARFAAWSYADWSVESIAAADRILGDVRVWKDLSDSSMSLVLINMTRPTKADSSIVRMILGDAHPMAIVVFSLPDRAVLTPEDKIVKIEVKPLVTRAKLADAIRKATETSNKRGQVD